MLGIVDTVLVARLGASATAGVGSAQQLMWFLICVLSALAIGSAVLVAQAVGAGDTQRAGRLARQSLIWSALLSIPLAIGGLLLARTVVGMYGLAPEAEAISVSYLHVTIGTVVVLVGLFIGGVLRGAGDTRMPMHVTAIANLVNVGLAYGMVYGHFAQFGIKLTASSLGGKQRFAAVLCEEFGVAEPDARSVVTTLVRRQALRWIAEGNLPRASCPGVLEVCGHWRIDQDRLQGVWSARSSGN